MPLSVCWSPSEKKSSSPLMGNNASAPHTRTRKRSAERWPMTCAWAGGTYDWAGPSTNSIAIDPPTYTATARRWRYPARTCTQVAVTVVPPPPGRRRVRRRVDRDGVRARARPVVRPAGPGAGHRPTLRRPLPGPGVGSAGVVSHQRAAALLLAGRPAHAERHAVLHHPLRADPPRHDRALGGPRGERGDHHLRAAAPPGAARERPGGRVRSGTAARGHAVRGQVGIAHLEDRPRYRRCLLYTSPS